MRTISYKLCDLNKARLAIGFVGENEHTQVRIDCAEIFAEYPQAEATMVILPPAGSAYPKTVTTDGTTVIWTVTDSDLAAEGEGELQLTFTENSVVVKSVVSRYRVTRSIIGSGDAPDPVQDWVDDANDLLADLEEKRDTDYWKGDKGDPGQDGAPGRDGQDGHTPVKGTDYWTAQDKAEIVSDVEGDIIDDTAGDGDTSKTWSADKLHDEFASVSTDITKLTPAATNADIGKALIVKTVADGVPTSYEYGEAGSIDPQDIYDAVDNWLDEHPEATTTVEDGSVTLPKLSNDLQTKINAVVEDVHDPSTNFINYNDVEEGYIKSDGTAKTSGNWHNTGYVELEPGETYYWSGLYGASAGYYAFYNSSKTMIYAGTSNLPNPFVPPANTKYGRFSKNGDITAGVWISTSNSEPSAYGTMLDSPMLVKKDQGAGNSGKLMGVGNDGVIVPLEYEYAEAEVWKKGNLYKQNELVANKYIYKTGNESAYEDYYCTPFIPVSGDYVYLSGFLDTYYAFYDSSKALVASYDTLGDMDQWTPGIKRATIPTGAVYGRFSSHNTPVSYAWISCVPENPPTVDQMAIKDIFPSTFNPDNPCDYESGSVGLFHKIVCIGDSLTSGVMNYDSGNQIDTPSSSTLAEWYSYPTQLTKMTGVLTTNMGDASETFKSWYELYGNTDFSGHDCAIIMLGVNDASFDVTDSETETYLCNIIDALKASVMNIKIFVCTVTPVFSNDRFPTHKHKSQVIRDTLEDHYANDHDVILCDIEQYSHVTQYTSYAAGHFTALGYWRFAKDMANFISWHIDNHMRDYRFVQFIGSDRTYSGD